MSSEERERVWVAMSDLFLDTDVRLNYAWVARVSAESPFSLEELRAIFRDEVAPAVEDNLFNIAGEWAMFPPEWLKAEIPRRSQANFTMRSGAMKDWEGVAILVEALRQIPRAEYELRVQVWRELAKIFLNKGVAMEKLELSGYPPQEIGEILFREVRPAYLIQAQGYYEHNPKMYPAPAEIDAQIAAWLRTIGAPLP